jgi:hypothetical protein
MSRARKYAAVFPRPRKGGAPNIQIGLAQGSVTIMLYAQIRCDAEMTPRATFFA